MKFVLCFIPSLYVKISGIKTNVDEYPYIPRHDFQHVFHLKY